jgi:aryl-alcohol dehydrogenase-like predicted oxidoreductase
VRGRLAVHGLLIAPRLRVLAWVLRHPVVTSALIGASRVQQLEDNVAALDNLALSGDELREIDRVLAEGGGRLRLTRSTRSLW